MSPAGLELLGKFSDNVDEKSTMSHLLHQGRYGLLEHFNSEDLAKHKSAGETHENTYKVRRKHF